MDTNTEKYVVGATIHITHDNRADSDEAGRIDPPIHMTIYGTYVNEEEFYIVAGWYGEMFICRPFTFPEAMISTMHGDLAKIPR